MIAEPDRATLSLAHEPLQFGLALDQWLVSQVAAIEMKEIEDVIDEAFALARLERRLQPGKTGNAARILDHHLTVNERGVRRELGDGGGDVGKFAASNPGPCA